MTLDIGILSLLLAAATFLIGRFAAAKQGGQADGELKADIRHIKDGIDKQESKLDGIIVNYEDVKVELESIRGRLNTLEQKVNYFHSTKE